MYAPQIFRMTQWGNYEIRNLTPESMEIFNEIFAILEQVETHRINNYREIWLRADRGTLDNMGFETEADAYEYYEVTNDTQLHVAFLNEYPEDTYWFKLESVNDGNYYRHLSLRNLDITIVSDELNYCPHSYKELLVWIRDELLHAVGNIKAGTCNQQVEAEVPLTLRYGTIPRSTYWKHCPQDKKSVLKDLTQAEIDRFIRIIEAEGEDYIPANRLKDVTFNQYLQIASYAFQGAGLDIAGKTVFEQFERYGEDFGGHILRELDLDSHSDFLRYYNDEFRMGGHPWGLRRGSSRTRIMLIPKRAEDGWYFCFGGNPNWNIYEIIKMYLALKDHNCPVRFMTGQETISYLKEEDLIGIVPSSRICAYCQNAFPGMDVNDFRHFDPIEDAALKDLIKWFPFEILKLREE